MSSQSWTRLTDKTMLSPRQRALADALAGVSASVAALWIFYPLELKKTRLQGSQCDEHGPSRLQRKRLTPFSLERILNFIDEHFAGWQYKTLHTATSSFCYFYIYSFLYASAKQAAAKKQSQQQHHLAATTRLLLGMVAAALNTLLTLPMDVMASQKQALPRQAEQDRYDDENDNDDEDDDDQELVLVEDERTAPQHATASASTSSTGSLFDHDAPPPLLDRLKPYWKGLLPSLLLCINPAIHYTVFDSLKYRLLQSQHFRMNATSSNNLSLLEAFMLGIAAKFVATMITYPLIRAKVVLMLARDASSTRSTNASSNHGLLACLLTDYQRHGFISLYRGLSLQLAHTLLKSALLVMVRERINRTTRRLLQK
ncbi:hypothetical protein MPSEU_000925100 [Mayamaea pseudoterrestris]|nr:hypothetical protein MPSEU_000925100 [Mayamaea pseudoterrestris]